MNKVSSSGKREKILRQRQLIDVLRTFALYEKSGLFGDLSPKDDAFERTVSRELAVQLSIDINGAKKIIRLSGLIHNEEVAEFMKSNSRLGVFSDYHFTKRYSSISKSGGNLCVELLEAFINGEDPQSYEVTLRERADRRKLDDIALRFTSDARDAFVAMFFKSVSVIATLCSFMSSDIQKLNLVSLGDVVQQYLSVAWTSDARQKTYHREVVASHLVNGWHIVSVVFKVAAQELRFSIQTDDTGNCEVSLDHEICRIEISDLRNNAHRVCETLVMEFAAWSYHLLCSFDRTITPDVFLGDMFEVLVLLSDKFGKALECQAETALCREKLTFLLRDIYDDAPTMADVKYDVAGMRPSKREKRISRKPRKTLWNAITLIKRARWDDTKVLKEYESFLRTAPSAHFAPGPPDATLIPETPPRSPPRDAQNLNKRSLQRELHVTVEVIGNVSGWGIRHKH